jgi:hypothetical protein
MLHLQPRLQSIQDQRRARKVQGPDLTQVTQIAAILADGTLDARGEVPLHLRKLRAQMPLPPFYLERLLERLDARPQQDLHGDGWMIGRGHPMVGHHMFGAPGLSLATVESERRARQLLEAAAPVLQPLNQQIPGFVEYKNGHGEREPIPASRADLFRTGLRQGIEMARLLDAHLIAPIRHDNLAPGDPFVQTTLYVVAPLFEPLASALIWPTLVHLLNYLGERHISQIVGIFATGSYAGDSSRAIEDAVSFASIAELEALTNLHPAASPAVEGLVRGDGVPALPGQRGLLESWVGRSLLDHIYLVDREKSNQGLVRNSYELSVLVGNALEAMITTDGNQYIEEQLGIDLRNAHERPYSLMGAAGDYVPLDYIFSAVHQQEEKRLIREVILAEESSPEEAAASLTDLAITQDQVIAQLIAQMPDLFLNVTPNGLDELAVHPNFVLPPSIAAEMRHLSPAGWLAAFEDRLQSVTQQFNRLAGVSALDYAWGLGALHENGLPKNANDRRLLPAAALYMRRTFVDLLAESPAGLRQAQSRLATWQAELEEARQRVNFHSPGQRNLVTAQRQLALRQWRTQYERNMINEPSLGQTLLRSSLLVLAVLLVAVGYWIAFDRPFDLIIDGGTLLGIFLGAYVGGIMSYRRRLTQIQRLRRERLALAQAELTSQLQERIQQGLLRAYDHLAQMLREMARALEDTNEALNQWALDDGHSSIPTTDAYSASHLYGPRVSDRLWGLCRSHLRAQQDREGRRGEERLRTSWRSVAWRRKLEALLLEERDGRPLSAAMQDLLRETVQSTISDLSAASAQAVRDGLVRELAQINNLEHLLWRDDAAPAYADGTRGASKQNLIHRYLEALWSYAKPAANYDVADRLAAHGIPVDFAAVWGSTESDLSETTLREFRSTLLPTDDPFRINFVRTVHGLTLEDLGSIRRYYMELMLLNQANLDQIALVDQQRRLLYGVESDAREEVRKPRNFVNTD